MPDNHLAVRIPYHEELLPVARNLPDRVWNGQQRVWLIPDTPRHTETLLQKLYETGLFNYTAPESFVGSKNLLIEYDRALEARHYSPRTRKTYRIWAERFVASQAGTDPSAWNEADINRFLTELAVKERVSASTQNQALAALLFLFRSVLNRSVGDLGHVIRARKPERLPVVMTRAEVRAVLEKMSGEKKLAAGLMYGAGLRLNECLSLRVQDIDFERNEILVRNGKGAKDRITMLPESMKAALTEQLEKVKALHDKDLSGGWGAVPLPGALDRKYPNAATDWKWQWMFPQERRWVNKETGREGRHHMDVSLMQRAVHQAAQNAGLTKRVSCHTFRHSFATHLIESGYDIRTVQELLGHNDVKTTMIYTHVLNSGPLGVKSPMDIPVNGFL
jgi:integron integrase